MSIRLGLMTTTFLIGFEASKLHVAGLPLLLFPRAPVALKTNNTVNPLWAAFHCKSRLLSHTILC